MLGQASVPLVGIVDIAVIGRSGDATALAGVALGTTIVSTIFWTFGFLRMGMTGLTAQAAGAGDAREVEALLLRGVGVGLAAGAAILAAQMAIVPAVLGLFDADAMTGAAARAYVGARFMGAPASLATFAVTGWLFGLGRTRATLLLQLVLNLANVALCLLLAGRLGWGARGVGLATAGADWIALATGLALVRGHLRRVPGLWDRAAIGRLFAVNADIMVRTLALLAMMAWLANAGARLGTATLAAQAVLMQFVTVAAFVLDGFAFTAEARVGQAVGAGSRAALLRAIRLTCEFAGMAAAGFTLTILLFGAPAIALLTTAPAVRALAVASLPLVALVPLIGTPAWMLDGIFIGATGGRALRNAAIVATGLYIATDLALRSLGTTGVWIALLAGYVYRAAALGAYLPALLAKVPREP